MNDCMAADNTTLCNQQRHQNDNSINGSEALIDNNNELEISLIKKDARLAKAFSRLSKANATLARTNSRQEKRIKELVEELNLVKDQLKTYQISYNTLAQEHNNLFSSPLDNKVYAVVDANNSNIRGAKPQTNYKGLSNKRGETALPGNETKQDNGKNRKPKAFTISVAYDSARNSKFASFEDKFSKSYPAVDVQFFPIDFDNDMMQRSVNVYLADINVIFRAQEKKDFIGKLKELIVCDVLCFCVNIHLEDSEMQSLRAQLNLGDKHAFQLDISVSGTIYSIDKESQIKDILHYCWEHKYMKKKTHQVCNYMKHDLDKLYL